MVLYQNYKEKALDIDSEEESEPREQKSEERLVIHHKPLRSTWSQVSVVSVHPLSLWGGEATVEICSSVAFPLPSHDPGTPRRGPCRLGNVSRNSAGDSENVNFDTSDRKIRS